MVLTHFRSYEKLIRETLPLLGTPYVEMVAVMAKYNPFAEKAGMLLPAAVIEALLLYGVRKVVEQQPSEEARRVADALSGFGFDLKLLGSQKYVLNKLQTLNDEGLEKLREAFIKHRHARFMKYFSAIYPSEGRKFTQKK